MKIKTKPAVEYYNERLHDMLRYKRPHGSKSEAAWIERFIKPYQPQLIDDAALVVTVNNSDGSQPHIMFSSHTDTVHMEDGMQHIAYNRTTHTYYKKDGKPLGADDAAGAWVMLEMIDAGVAGVYVFHRCEERGGIGSAHIADKHYDFLERFDYAVAFDRKGSTSVITHQGMTRCCSDAFAQALADALNDDGVSMYVPDDTGVFTDTANYTSDIPECTNLSCGYDNEHSGNETLHVPTLFALRDACLRVDWQNLPVERNPAVREVKKWTWDDYAPFAYTYNKKDNDTPYLYNMTRSEMVDMAYTDPETLVDLVREELFGEQLKQSQYQYDNSINDIYFERGEHDRY